MTSKMKEKFFEYYPLTQEDLLALWRDSILVLDTNILLNLYRYTESSRKDILGILEKHKEKLWMPFQVGWEYHNNREAVIETIFGLEDILYKQIQNSFDGLKNKYRSDYSRNPFMSEEVWENKLDKTRDSLVKFVHSRYDGAPAIKVDDTILSELNRLYAGKVGEGFSNEELERIFGEGKTRYAASIPPGYKDQAAKKDKGSRHLFGDLIIWKEIIRKAKADKKDIFFVTEDLKEDWMRIVDGKKRGPRWELMREFYDETGGQKVVIMSLDRFAGFVHDLPDNTVKPKTIREVESLREDNYRNAVLENILAERLYHSFLEAQQHAPDPTALSRMLEEMKKYDLERIYKQISTLNKTPAVFPFMISHPNENETPGKEVAPQEGEDERGKEE